MDLLCEFSTVLSYCSYLHHLSKGSSRNINLSPTPELTASGGVTISSPVKAVLSTTTISHNLNNESNMVSLSSMNSGGFAISTASKAAAAVSSLANLVPNAGRERFLHNALVNS